MTEIDLTEAFIRVKVNKTCACDGHNVDMECEHHLKRIFDAMAKERLYIDHVVGQ